MQGVGTFASVAALRFNVLPPAILSHEQRIKLLLKEIDKMPVLLLAFP